MKFNRLEIKLLAACVMYALCVGYAFADEWTGKDKQLHLAGGSFTEFQVAEARRRLGGE